MAWVTWKLMFFKNIKIAMVANKLSTSMDDMFNKVVFHLEGLPEWMYSLSFNCPFKHVFKKNSSNFKKFANDNELRARAGGKNGLRGSSPNIVILDEFAFFEHDNEFWTAAKSTVSMGGQMIIISTPNGNSNNFYEIFEEGRTGKNGFDAVELKWYHDDRLNTDLRFVRGDDVVVEYDHEEQKKLLAQGYKPTSTWYEVECRGFNGNKRKIAQELEGVFIGSGTNIFEEETLSYYEGTTIRDPKFIYGLAKEQWVWEDPQVDVDYVLCSDVSGGNGGSGDYSTFHIFRTDTFEQVMEYQGYIPQDLLGVLIADWGARYNFAFVVIDVSGGYGWATMNKLLELGYKNIYYSEISDRNVQGRLKDYKRFDNKFPGFVITPSNRMQLMENFEAMVRKKELVIRSWRLMYEMKHLINRNGKVDHNKNGHDDLVMALAIGLHVVVNEVHRMNKSAETVKAMLDSWIVLTPEDYAEIDYLPMVPENKVQHRMTPGDMLAVPNGQSVSEYFQYDNIFII